MNPERSWRPRITRDGGGPRIRFPRLKDRRFEVEWSGQLGPAASWSRYEAPENDPRTASEDGEASIPLPPDVDGFYRVRIAEE